MLTIKKFIISPVRKQALQKEIQKAETILYTSGDKSVFIVDFDHFPCLCLMLELGRLREITFRYVGEGTGRQKDIDDFDPLYKHLVLWDHRAMEVMGAYCLGIGHKILAQGSASPMYTHSLFSTMKR